MPSYLGGAEHHDSNQDNINMGTQGAVLINFIHLWNNS